jgi:hypothetical protein
VLVRALFGHELSLGGSRMLGDGTRALLAKWRPGRPLQPAGCLLTRELAKCITKWTAHEFTPDIMD